MHAIFPVLWALQTFKTAKVTFSLTQGHLAIALFDKPYVISY